MPPIFWEQLFGCFCGALAAVVVLMVLLSWLMKPLSYTETKVAAEWVKSQEDLTLKNYEKCRDLMVENIKIMETNETYIAAAIAAVITFGIAQKDASLFYMQAIMAPIIALMGVLRWAGLRHVIRIADAYSRYVEGSMAIDGWATYYKARSRGVLNGSRMALWGGLLTLTIVYSAVCFTHGRFADDDTKTSASLPAAKARP